MIIKIGDFSKMSFVTIKTLHHYDEIGLLKPVKVDTKTGYRYYSPEQLPRIQYILALKEMGLSLDDTKELINNSLSLEDIRKLFILKRSELKQRLQEEKNRLEKVEKLLNRIEKKGEMPKRLIVTKSIKPMIVASVRDVLPNFKGEEIAKMFQELLGYVFGLGIKPAGPTMMIYRDEDYKEQHADIEVAIQIAEDMPEKDRIKCYQLPAVDQAAVITYKGRYEDMGEAYNEVMRWVAENGYIINAPCRELYIVSPGDTDDPSKYVSEIQIPIIKAEND